MEQAKKIAGPDPLRRQVRVREGTDALMIVTE
jgi:hypothetical protein